MIEECTVSVLNNKKMTLIKFIAFTVLFISITLAMFPDKIEGIKKGSLTLTIESNKSKLHLDGSEYLKINATITNNGKGTVKLVLPGDGSQMGWRTPIIKWSVVKIKDGETELTEPDFSFRTSGKCKTINPVEERDFVQLRAGKNVSIDEWLRFTKIPNELGKYRIQMLYKNDPTIQWKGSEYHAKRLLRKARKTTAVEIISNEIVIEIIDYYK